MIVPHPYLECRTYCPLFNFTACTLRLVVSPAVVAIAVTSAAAVSAKARALGASLIDGQSTALEGLAIQPGNGAREVFTFGQLDEAKSPRLTGQLVLDDHGRGHLKPRCGHKFVETGVSGGMRKITYVQFRSHLILQIGAALRHARLPTFRVRTVFTNNQNLSQSQRPSKASE